MKSRLRTTLLAAAVAALLPTVSLAANPNGRATYVGTRGGKTSLLETVYVKVAPGGRSATGTYFCRDLRTPQGIPRFNIAGGRFDTVKKLGSLTLIGLKGRFVTPDRIDARLDVRTSCNGKVGKITLRRKVA